MKKRLYSFLAILVLVLFNVSPAIVSADGTDNLNSRVNETKIDNINSYSVKNGLINKTVDTGSLSGGSVINRGSQTVNNSSNKSRTSVPSTSVKWHLSERYYQGKFVIDFYVDSITGPTPVASNVQIVFYSEPSINGPVSVTQMRPITSGPLKTGLLGSTDVPAKTTFWATGGAVGLLGQNTTVPSISPIPQSMIYLQNKLAQNFPQYVDTVSGRDAESPINTNWSKLSASNPWSSTDRYNFIKEYSETYGNQTQDFWNYNQVHHIRPRIYGGGNDFSNLMPVLTSSHQLITTWFVNY